jgi:hypothetical protein
MASNTSPGRAGLRTGLLGFVLIAHTLRPNISVAPPFRRGAVRRHWTAVLESVRAAARTTPPEKKEPFYPPRRTAFVEEAAMSREMYRL